MEKWICQSQNSTKTTKTFALRNNNKCSCKFISKTTIKTFFISIWQEKMHMELNKLLKQQERTRSAVHIQATVRGWLVRKNTNKSKLRIFFHFLFIFFVFFSV